MQIGCDEAARCPAADGERSWTIGDVKPALRILENKFTREGRRCGRIEGGVVRGVRIRRAVDVEARHRGAPPSRVSRDRTGVSVLDRSGRTGWTCGRGRPGDRPNPHAPDPEPVDPATSSAPGHACVARQSGASRQGSAPAKVRFPRATKASWAGRCRTSRWCSTPPRRRRVREERLPDPGRVEGT